MRAPSARAPLGPDLAYLAPLDGCPAQRPARPQAAAAASGHAFPLRQHLRLGRLDRGLPAQVCQGGLWTTGRGSLTCRCRGCTASRSASCAFRAFALAQHVASPRGSAFTCYELIRSRIGCAPRRTGPAYSSAGNVPRAQLQRPPAALVAPLDAQDQRTVQLEMSPGLFRHEAAP